jgi:hypothetical protein
MKNGKWIDNPNAPAIVVCECKERYIKTRPNQTHCLRCTAKKKVVA